MGLAYLNDSLSMYAAVAEGHVVGTLGVAVGHGMAVALQDGSAVVLLLSSATTKLVWGAKPY